MNKLERCKCGITLATKVSSRRWVCNVCGLTKTKLVHTKMIHKKDCQCQKCDPAAYNRLYYAKNKERIRLRESTITAPRRKYVRKTKEIIGKFNAIEIKEKHGKDFFKNIGRLGGESVKKKYGADYYKKLSKKSARKRIKDKEIEVILELRNDVMDRVNLALQK